MLERLGKRLRQTSNVDQKKRAGHQSDREYLRLG
jgi:hypothetical protein